MPNGDTSREPPFKTCLTSDDRRHLSMGEAMIFLVYGDPAADFTQYKSKEVCGLNSRMKATLLEALTDAVIKADGIQEASGERKDIEPSYWRFVDVNDLDEFSSAVLPKAPGDATNFQTWSSIRFPYNQIEQLRDRLCASKSGHAEEHSAKFKTGLPGRPVASHIVKDEFQRRAETAEAEFILANEAKYLEDWWEEQRKHNQGPPLKARSIENAIRSMHKKYKSQIPQK